MQCILRCWAGLLVLAATFVSGCSDKQRTYKVQGKVTFENKPMMGGGSISFVPLGNLEGKTAGGEIDAEGNYTLMTHKPGDGSMVGEFRVVIYQVTEQEGENRGDGAPAGKSKGIVPEADRIPVIYSDTYHSPLRAKVEAKDKNEINFALERNPAPAALRDFLFGERFASIEPNRMSLFLFEPVR
jgi:hypothetical protein